MVSDGIRRSARWPKAPNALANTLRRMASNLRAAGIELNSSRADRLGRRILSVQLCNQHCGNIVSHRQWTDRGLADKFPGPRPTARQPAVAGGRQPPFLRDTTTPLTITDDDLQSLPSAPPSPARPTTSEWVLEYDCVDIPGKRRRASGLYADREKPSPWSASVTR